PELGSFHHPLQARPALVEPPHKPSWREQHDDEQQYPGNSELEVGKCVGSEQPAAELFVDEGTECRTRDGTLAPQHRYHDRLCGELQIECIGWLNESALEEVKAAGDGGQKSRKAIGEGLIARRRHTEHGCGVFVLTDRQQTHADFGYLNEVAEIERKRHDADKGVVNHPERSGRSSEGLE